MPFVDAAGHRIEYARVEEPGVNGPPLVFLHDGLGSVAGWGEFPARLARATNSAWTAYNRVGHGRSSAMTGPRTVRFMHDEALHVLPAVLAALEIERPVLVGHSDGASIALIYASQHPGRVAGLALEAPHVMVEDETVGGITEARRRFRTGSLRERLRKHHFANTESLFETWSEVWLSDPFRTWSLEADLGSVRCPVLVVQGEDDSYGSMKQVRLIEARAGGRVTRLVLPACGHVPHRERTREVLEAMRQFVTSLV
jgi:pimeloyl-ACP methyl ester carboxylesterase